MKPVLGPTLTDVLDAIDIQLLADSPEVVLIRDHAALLGRTPERHVRRTV